MKTLYLIRHAKSSWDNPLVDDFDRPLNKRGFRDAQNMGKYLNNKKIQPELIISSPALRALTTAQIIAENINYPQNKIIERMDLYSFDDNAKDIFKVLKSINKDVNMVAIFGHNPTFTYLANKFSMKHYDNVPTCGIICLNFNTNLWDDIATSKSELEWFMFPKMLKNKQS